jgi:hypothetical protein
MDINEKINLVNFAQRKAAGVGSPKDVAAAQGYVQALCHAKIITTAKMAELQDLAEKSYKIKLDEKRTVKK